LIVKLNLHKGTTVKAEKFRESLINEAGIEFHLYHLSIIWINMNIEHPKIPILMQHSTIIYTDSSRIKFIRLVS